MYMLLLLLLLLHTRRDFDWSNAKDQWAKSQPMNCEEMLVEQVEKTTAASPDTTVWICK